MPSQNRVNPRVHHTPDGTQSKATSDNNPITKAMLFIIATNAILNMEKFLRANEYWEELDAGQHMMKKWKTTYRASAKKATIKKKAIGNKDQFGASHGVMQQPEEHNPWSPRERRVTDEP